MQRARFWFGALIVLFIFSFTIFPASGAQIDDLRREQQEVSRRIEQQRQVVQQKDREIKSLDQELKELDQSIGETEDELAEIRRQLAGAENDLRVAEKELRQAEADLQERTEIFADRLRALYQKGSVDYLEVLFASTSLTDFLVRRGLLEKIAEQDMALLEELEARRQDIEARKADLEVRRNQIAELERETASKAALLEEKKKSKEAVLAQAQASKDAAEKALADEEEASRQLAAKIKELEAQMAKTEFVGGQFKWPLPGYSRITSEFGWRIHPIYGDKRFHDGIDIAAPRGTPIVAAADGTVILAGWYGGYGNAVVISHGGNITTLYGHMSQILVSNGQRVSKGDRIGLVGTTGTSTGNHLHFGVRKSGDPINPWPYLK